MGAPIKDMTPANEASAEALLTTLRTIDPAERRKHASVFNYWLSIRGKRQFPAIRDLDPLEISDAGPFSLLMEMIGGGEDAEIRHLGHAIKQGVEAQRISDVEAPSLLACIHAQLPVVASSRQAFAFEDRFDTPEGKRRCWVTLLPLSTSGTWIDFVYGFVSLEGVSPAAEQAEAAEDMTSSDDDDAGEIASSADEAADAFRVELRPLDDGDASENHAEPAPEPEAVAEDELDFEPEAEPEPEIESATLADEEPVAHAEPDPEPAAAPEQEVERPTESGFSSKLLAGLASVGGFYGKVTQSQPEPEPEPEPEPAVESDSAFEPVAELDVEVAQVDAPEQAPIPAREPESIPEPQQATAWTAAMEVTLNDKLSGVRAMAEEARHAQERSNLALYEGLSAAYDFALDAEDQPEAYLRLVEERGLKIQLRSPMKPVVKLAFDGLTDESTIGQLEAVLSWALKSDLPRGSLAERIIAEGGVNRLLSNMPN
ncbi:MAG: hypothetical protein V4696_04260 [Pseudomonadota bacterium]